MRSSVWSSDVCSSDLFRLDSQAPVSPIKPSHRDGGSISGNSSTVRSHHWCWRWREEPDRTTCIGHQFKGCLLPITLTIWGVPDQFPCAPPNPARSEEHTSELQSLMRTSYAVFC